MIQKDIIQRLIQDISRFLAKIANLKGEQAFEYINEVYFTDLKLTPSYLDGLTPENIVEELTKEKGLNVHQLEFMAEVLTKEGMLLQESEKPHASEDKLEKALIIFNFVEEEQALFSWERKIKMDTIEKALKK